MKFKFNEGEKERKNFFYRKNKSSTKMLILDLEQNGWFVERKEIN